MIAILFILFVLVAATAFVVYRRQQNLLAGRRAQRELMSQRPPRSLFADTQQALDETAQRAPADAPAQSYMEQRSAFMARAAAGDLSVLDDAHATSDAALYRVVLNELVERAAKVDDKLHALVAYVEGREALRGSVELAEAYSAVWQESPDRARTATMLHLAALADDADTFRKAAVIAALFWQNGQLPEFTAAQLRELIDSQFWLISADARRTGAGFVLKQRLGSLRAELSEDGATMERSDEQRAASPDGI